MKQENLQYHHHKEPYYNQSIPDQSQRSTQHLHPFPSDSIKIHLFSLPKIIVQASYDTHNFLIENQTCSSFCRWAFITCRSWILRFRLHAIIWSWVFCLPARNSSSVFLARLWPSKTLSKINFLIWFENFGDKAGKKSRWKSQALLD